MYDTTTLQYVDKLITLLDEGIAVDTVYLDFAKAFFDNVPHKRLLMKLKCYGVNGRVLEWFQSFLSSRKQELQLVERYLHAVHELMSSAVCRRGSVLGSLLFICYTSDMPETLASFIYMYADDTKIVRAVTCDTDSDGLALQSDYLDQLGDWSQKWQLQRFIVSKCSHALWKKQCELDAGL